MCSRYNLMKTVLLSELSCSSLSQKSAREWVLPKADGLLSLAPGWLSLLVHGIVDIENGVRDRQIVRIKTQR